jgi:hypothetical protein
VKRFKTFALSALALGAIGVVGAPAASAHSGYADITCTGATFHYSGFSDRTHHIQETIYEEPATGPWQRITQVDTTFTGTGGSHTVNYTLTPGTHTIVADAWQYDPDTGDTAHILGFAPPYKRTVTCPPPPCTTNCNPCSPPSANCNPCPPGKISMRWHYKYLGTSGSWSATKSTNCPGDITFQQQGMEGDLKVTEGERVDVGYSFKAPRGPITVSNAKLVFVIRCVGGGTPSASSWTVNLPTQTYNVTSGDWQPSGDQHSSLVYQGGATMPHFCASGRVRLDKGGVFSATFS